MRPAVHILPVALFLTTACVALGHEGARREQTVVPWRWGAQRALLIGARVNGVEGTFIFDTGTGVCVISDRLVNQLNLIPQPARRTDGTPVILPNGVRLTQVRASRLQLGGSVIAGVRFGVYPAAALQRLAEQSVDGIIGLEAVRDCAVLLDFEMRQIRLIYPGKLRREEAEALGLEGAYRAPIRDPSNRDQYTMQIFFGGIAADALVDIGTPMTYLRKSLAAELRLVPLGPPQTLTNLQETLAVQTGYVPAVRIGDFTIEHLRVAYLSEHVPDHPNLLGLDVLSRFRVLIDYPAEAILLKPLSCAAGEKKQ